MITLVDLVLSADGGQTQQRFSYTIPSNSSADAICIALDYLEVDLNLEDGALKGYSLVITARPADCALYDMPLAVAA
jgi:hypothetical protein